MEKKNLKLTEQKKKLESEQNDLNLRLNETQCQANIEIRTEH